MARPKAHIRKALSDSHLKGIGLVAANWNTLEFSLMLVIYQISGTTIAKTFSMISPNGLDGLLDILHRLLIDSEQSGKWNTFKSLKLPQGLKDLQSKRNHIVHATWSQPKHPNRMAELLGVPPPRTPPVKASGTGVKKRGTGVLVPVEHTAAEMRAIAKDIEAIRLVLLDWAKTLNPTLQQRLWSRPEANYPPPDHSLAMLRSQH